MNVSLGTDNDVEVTHSYPSFGPLVTIAVVQSVVE